MHCFYILCVLQQSFKTWSYDNIAPFEKKENHNPLPWQMLYYFKVFFCSHFLMMKYDISVFQVVLVCAIIRL